MEEGSQEPRLLSSPCCLSSSSFLLLPDLRICFHGQEGSGFLTILLVVCICFCFFFTHINLALFKNFEMDEYLLSVVQILRYEYDQLSQVANQSEL